MNTAYRLIHPILIKMIQAASLQLLTVGGLKSMVMALICLFINSDFAHAEDRTTIVVRPPMLIQNSIPLNIPPPPKELVQSPSPAPIPTPIQAQSAKADYAKLMDQRRLQRLYAVWELYSNRNRIGSTDAELKRVQDLKNKINYPAISFEETPSAQITAVMRESINDLGHELEKEVHVARMNGDASNSRLASENLKHLHFDIEHNLETFDYWMHDTPESQRLTAEYYARHPNLLKLQGGGTR